MTGVVLDTDIISFIAKNHSSAAAYQADIVGQVPIISFQALAELLRWPLERKWGLTRRNIWEQELRQYVVQPSSWALRQTWADVRANCNSVGHSIDSADAWQAATAIYLGVPLISHNRRHFAGVPGLQLVSHAP